MFNKTIFKTEKKENFKSKTIRRFFRIVPSYWNTGGRVCFISSDFKEMHITLWLNRSTKNILGTVFGGSIYSSVDPIFVYQFMNILGKDYIIWDQAATIKFLKPIKKQVYARFLIKDDVLTEIIENVKTNQKYTKDLIVKYEDEDGIIYAEIIKTIYFASKQYYTEKQKLSKPKLQTKMG